MTPKEIINRLEEGNSRFVNDQLDHKQISKERRAQIESEQNPFAVIISCADSRVVPEYIFDAGLGELFVIRVAGNVANRSTIASVEYAVSQLKTKLVLVLGHQNCGAVKAALEGEDMGKNLNHLVNHLSPVLNPNNSKINLVDLICLNALNTLSDLSNHSKIIQQAINEESVKLIAGYYSLETGKVKFLDDDCQ